MMSRLLFLVVGLLLFVSSPLTLCLSQDGLFLQQVKRSLSDPTHSLSNWNERDATPCNWTGIGCDHVTLRVTSVDLSSFQLAGSFPIFLCRLPSLIFLSLPYNSIGSSLTPNISSCQSLQYLDLAQNLLVGPIPDTLSQIPSLRHLNLSSNNFSGGIPASFGEFRRLETLNLAANLLNGSIPSSLGNISSLKELLLALNSLSQSPLPSELGNLTNLEVLWLARCDLVGQIPATIGRLTRLINLDLSSNGLTGSIPWSITGMKSIVQIELYGNSLSGVLPSGMSNLTKLLRLDVSMNNFTGTIPDDLCGLPLESLNVNDNRFEGSLSESITRSANLSELKLFNNTLSGPLPSQLGKNSPLRILDVSYNGFSGEIPSHLCENGLIPEEIGSLGNLVEFSGSNNRLTGLPGSLVKLSGLTTLDLSDNELSGEIPVGIQAWKKLNELNLANNRLYGEIPSEIGGLQVLNYLDLSGNLFSGKIPLELQNLKLNLLNLSNNRLTGSLPPFYANENYRSSFVGNPGLCGDLPDLCPRIGGRKGRADFWVLGLIFGLAAVVLVVGVVWFYWKYQTFMKNKKGIAMSKWRSFHKLSFSAIEILDCLREDSVIGSGASGKVYKVVLSNGDVAAVKKLCGGTKKVDGTVDSEKDEFKAEVETLGRIRHKNIVRLWCCYDTGDCKLLVYEYMPNGSLGDVLRGSKGGLLDWPTRYNIALDAAEGLSYLHHDCVPPIVHRDVKSNNILLDGEFRARVADFGVAKAVATVSKGEEAMSVIAGSCGYIAPEYAYTLNVNEKSDIYSFGVVILELVTGRLPTDPEFGERDLVKWVCTTLDQKGVDYVIDGNLDSKYKKEIGKVLDIGLMCTAILPISRPPMRKVVKLLQEVVAEKKTKTAKKDGMFSPYYYEEASEQGGIV
ncbi:hypothetical protein I3842_03G173600 [Carya illinoinensis]|uniref:non-specific serine/threonine protein kinase n=1 Tax=Carya illinoinensis TaxID=32201 RepID=A0A922FL21_CARIL|nr:hypothetical protein I3842_03G173600 [Carya illinoinensis]